MIRKNTNIPDVKFLDAFNTQLSKAPEEILEAFFDTLQLFLVEPDHPYLRNHALKEKFAGLRSIDITPDARAVFKETRRGEQRVITFHMVGTHKELYE